MIKLNKVEKDKLRKAIKKKRRRMRGKKPSLKAQAALKKQKLLSILTSKTPSIQGKEAPKRVETKTNESTRSNGVTANPRPNTPDYVEFEDLKPEFQEIVERFIKTDKEYMRQVREEEEKEERGDADLGVVEKEGSEEEPVKKPKLSKRKLKKLERIPVAQLKVLVDRPDLVESWDVTAKDPLLLMWLKSYKNTVVVPKHWSQKRKFLQNKRGRFSGKANKRVDEEDVQVAGFHRGDRHFQAEGPDG